MDKVRLLKADAEILARLLHAAAVCNKDRDLFWSREMGPWDRVLRINTGIPIQ